MQQKFIRLFFLCLMGSLFFVGCSFEQSLPTTTAFPTNTPAPSPTLPPEPSDWTLIQPGLERRTITVQQDGKYLDTLHTFRLDPNLFRFDVAYNPKGQTLDSWQSQTGALIVVNGGYFRQEEEIYVPNGLTIIDEQPQGESFGNFGGMLAITENGPELRWLAQQPYDAGETLLAALQSFPILVKPGGEIGFPAEHEDYVLARRTVIAQDRSGRILLMVASQGNLSLHQLSAFLTDSDLNLDIAINLDGGPSSGILIAEPFERIQALGPLPIVITVHHR